MVIFARISTMQEHHVRPGNRIFKVAFVLFACSCGGSSANNLIKGTTCSGTFDACGGDPTGTWDIVSICAEGDLVSAFNAELSAKQAACSSTFTAASLAAAGSVTYAAGNVSYTGNVEVSESLSYTSACVSAVSGGATLNASTCSQIQNNLNNEPNTQSTCNFTTANCNCNTTVSNSPTSGTFTASKSTITESNGSSYEFCVNGTTMNQRELISGNAYAVTQLRRR
jgi:hypothetical protein